jgi:hypothetical protein
VTRTIESITAGADTSEEREEPMASDREHEMFNGTSEPLDPGRVNVPPSFYERAQERREREAEADQPAGEPPPVQGTEPQVSRRVNKAQEQLADMAQTDHHWRPEVDQPEGSSNPEG